MNKKLKEQLKTIVKSLIYSSDISARYLIRIKEGKLTRDENEETHFCVYFAAIDPAIKEVFIGYHKKSGLWLFNGGHIDKGETLTQAVEREICEEWGIKIEGIGKPSLLTITEINNPSKQICKRHFDIWHFVIVSKDSFSPDKEKFAKEFSEMKWLSIYNAKNIVKDPSTIDALNIVEEKFFSGP